MKVAQVYLLCLGIIFLCIVHACNTKQFSTILGPVSQKIDYSTTVELISFGEQLFFDKRLSADNSIACATCHQPEKAFTDGLTLSRGINGKTAMRNASGLYNVSYQHHLMFDGEVKTIEIQALVPLRDTVEMGSNMGTLVAKLDAIPEYNRKAKELFKTPFTAFVLTRSLAAFQRSLISDNSRFDREIYKKEINVLSDSERRGWKLFSSKLYCTTCHSAPHFTNFKVENNGLYTSYDTISDKGRFRINMLNSEVGNFKTPSLRNIALTAPYMHDGSLKTLDAVIDHYMKGGNGHINQNKAIVPFKLSTEEKIDLKAFLQSLTDNNYKSP
jgi:cytochrome c peroxidase